MNRHDKARVEEDGELLKLRGPGIAHRDLVYHHKQVAIVLVDLGPLLAMGAVFDRQGMEPKALLQKGKILIVEVFEVDPAGLALGGHGDRFRPFLLNETATTE